jgi:hypothetical protein
VTPVRGVARKINFEAKKIENQKNRKSKFLKKSKSQKNQIRKIKIAKNESPKWQNFQI